MSSRFSGVPPTVADRLRHILHSIEEIQGLLADASQQEFADNRLLCLAVERLLEFVREASRHIPGEAKERAIRSTPISSGSLRRMICRP
jgi:uncharacterized protein with HEPN domain